MSTWTQIAGNMRIDGGSMALTGSKPNKRRVNKTMKDIFGYTCNFYSSTQQWDRCNVPRGSEGSLQYKLMPEKDESLIAMGQVIIWGDLRNYDSEKEIFKWLQGVLVKLKTYDMWVRELAFTVNAGGVKYSIVLVENKDGAQSLDLVPILS